MLSRSIAVLAGALVTSTFAHGILGEFVTDGVSNAGFPTDAIYRIQNGNPVPDIAAWSTEAVDRGYIEPNNMNTLDINCHKNAKPGVLIAKVAAGGNVDFVWPGWPHDVSSVFTYVASCGGNCAQADKATLKWVKIDQAGYDGEWAGRKLMDNDFTWTTKVPATLAAGNYVFRNEIINLHSGIEQNGAQLYPQCVNIEITGSGTDTPAGVLGVELYKPDDAGILFDPYVDNIDYPFPGPAIYSPGASTSVPATSATIITVPQTATPTSTTLAPVVTSAASIVTSTAPSATSSIVAPTTLVTRTSVLPTASPTAGAVVVSKWSKRSNQRCAAKPDLLLIPSYRSMRRQELHRLHYLCCGNFLQGFQDV